MQRGASHDWSGDAAAFAVAAGVLFMASLGAWALAIGHMAEIGMICGQSQPHCIWCGVGVMLDLAGLVALAGALTLASGGPSSPRQDQGQHRLF